MMGLDHYKNKHLDKFSVVFVSFMLSLAFIKTIMNYLPQAKGIVSMMVLTALVALVLYVIKPFRGVFLAGFLFFHGFLMLSLLQGASLFTNLYVKLTIPYVGFFENLLFKLNLNDFYGKMIGNIAKSMMGSDIEIPEKYVTFFWINMTILIGLFVINFVEKRGSLFFLMLGLVYYFLGWFFYLSNLEINFALYFIALLSYKQFLNYEVLNLDDKKGHDDYTHAFFTSTLLLVLIFTLSAFAVWILPTVSINSKINNFVPRIEGLRDEFPTYKSGRTFSFSNTMYAPYGNILGGPIKDKSYDNVMRLKADEGGLYLRGRVKNVYDGKAWSSDFTSYKIRTAIKDLPKDFEMDDIIAVEIFPDQIKTRTIFSPYIFIKSSYKDKNIFQNEDMIPIISKDLNSDYKPYTVYYLEDYTGSTLSEEEANLYLGLPENGLPVTKNLAKELTKDLSSDDEKMKALVAHLRLNYSYSLEPEFYQGPIDFVEKFIAEDKIGYCTYFASSLAVMGRSINIPTRYVEGYLSGYFKDQEGYYNVTADRAHAWVEAYIEGEGWKVYEATPSYNEPGDASFIETPTSTGGNVDVLEDVFEKIEEPLEDFNLNRDMDSLVVEDIDERTPLKKNDNVYWVLPVLLLLGLIMYVFYRKKKKSLKEKMFAMIYLMNQVAKGYKPENEHLWPKGTILSFLEEDLNLILNKDTQRIIDNTLYDSGEAHESELEALNMVYKDFFKRLLKYKGFFVYLKVKMRSIFY